MGRVNVSDSSLLRVATIGPAHALRGEVRLTVHTDDVAGRLHPGATLETEPAAVGPLEVAAIRAHKGQYLASFAGHADRNAAEALRGVVLLAPPAEEEDAWYPAQLQGLTARSPQGESLGTVAGVQHAPAHDLLRVDVGGRQVLVPFVEQIVTDIDTDAGTVTIDAPGGLWDEL